MSDARNRLWSESFRRGRGGFTLIELKDASLVAFDMSLTDATRTSMVAASADGSSGSEAVPTGFVEIGRAAA
jgi:hypothetical protein